MADTSNMTYLKNFTKSLKRYCISIFNYAKQQLTSARIEAGNVAIGMIRKCARAIRDTEYLNSKLGSLLCRMISLFFTHNLKFFTHINEEEPK
jgi:transposase